MRSALKITGCLLIILQAVSVMGYSQNNRNNDLKFPPEYFRLNSDTARMRFLVYAIKDSLDDDRLNYIYGWAKEGLALAEKNDVDTMKGIFYFDIGKAFTYKYLKPDSAVVYYKKVLPYFPDKLSYYNLISLREIMERYCEAGNRDSAMVYVDSLHARLDTMTLANPRKVSIYQNMASVYQYYGMFKTAISLYEASIEGSRKKTNKSGLGIAMANLAELYDESGDDVNAVRYSKEALGYLSGINMPFMLTASNLAAYYGNLGKYDSALYYLRLSDSVTHITGDEVQEMVANKLILFDILFNQKKYSQAKALLISAGPKLRENPYPSGLVKYRISMAMADTAEHRYSVARDTLLSALSIAKENDQEIYVILSLQALVEVNAKLNNYKEAYKYQEEYIRRKDSLTNTETKAKLADFEVVYKTKQKEDQIVLLQKDNDIKGLQLKNSRQTNVLYLLVFLFLLGIAGVVFYQRNKRVKINAQKIKAELQTQVLRSQMNPHFIFNSLNSIENFIMQNDKRQASDYLNKFSKLIRSILDSSRNEVVPLVKDMEALQLYVELEQLRFNNKFTYKSFIDPELRGGDYCVPSLLIQPFVENAIVHGLAHSESGELDLTVTASLENDKIRYVIQDNGVGREKAKVYNMQNKPYHKSVGLKITEERINMFNRQGFPAEAISITDLYNEYQEPQGTKVEILLKAV